MRGICVTKYFKFCSMSYNMQKIKKAQINKTDNSLFPDTSLVWVLQTEICVQNHLFQMWSDTNTNASVIYLAAGLLQNVQKCWKSHGGWEPLHTAASQQQSVFRWHMSNFTSIPESAHRKSFPRALLSQNKGCPHRWRLSSSTANRHITEKYLTFDSANEIFPWQTDSWDRWGVVTVLILCRESVAYSHWKNHYLEDVNQCSDHELGQFSCIILICFK